METWQLIGIALLVIVLLASPLWKGLLTSRAQKAGEDAGKAFAAKRLPAALDALSTTLDLQTDADTATEVINAAVTVKPKKATAVGPGRWHVTFADRDDVHLRLTDIPGGVRLAVVKTIEFQQFPQGGGDWAKFRERIVEAARARGVATSEGATPHLQRVGDPSGNETLSGAPASIWVAPAG
ncbi:hypothetical protein EXU48_04740 [Occultella glacieicola]|uniref:Preprotein translocase subunit YajC n=1 Tax=Occultella glacieicola TaxID=2518684 RepID=A0ABY2E9P3_9MICO|nr:hypothetical protein [Occultella glacieicola]TDE97500.1 hypothetical protein EXU48_04740 [Occultella glacieicola]